MTATVESLLPQVLLLRPEDQRELLDRVVQSWPTENEIDANIVAEWDRRLQRLTSGESQGVDPEAEFLEFDLRLAGR